MIRIEAKILFQRDAYIPTCANVSVYFFRCSKMEFISGHLGKTTAFLPCLERHLLILGLYHTLTELRFGIQNWLTDWLTDWFNLFYKRGRKINKVPSSRKCHRVGNKKA